MKRTRRDFLATTAAAAGVFPPALFAQTGSSVPLAPPDKQAHDTKLEEPPARTLGWAIVGLGKLSIEEILPAFGECKLARPAALVSGHPEKARKLAKTHDIPEKGIYAYEDFDKIAEDPSIDVVYIVLPNSMHAEYTIRALEAGKHVLCEKPMATSVEDGERMAAVAEKAGKKLSIGYRLHHEPLNRQVMAWCKERRFGKIKSITSSNCQNVEAPNIRLSKDLGGGPVGDVGVYSINAARYILNEEPVEVYATAIQPKDDPRFREVPESVAFNLRYPSGAIAVCDCSFGTTESRRYRVQCTKGYIEMDPSFAYRGLKLRTKEDLAKETESSEDAIVSIRQVNHFAAQMDGFSKSIIDSAEIISPAAIGIADLRIIAAIQESINTGKPVPIPKA